MSATRRTASPKLARPKTYARLLKDIETQKGRWKFSGNHQIVYRERGAKKDAALTGSLVAAQPGALVLALKVRENQKRTVTGTVKLAGKWELDSKNRITFYVKRGLEKYDKLTFQGAWSVNRNHEVVYTYRTQQVFRGRGRKKRRTRLSTQKIVFEGRWDITEKNRLTYRLGMDSMSAFRFRGAFETQTLRAKDGVIRYQAGVEYLTRRGTRSRRKQTITLFGKWKLSRDLALTFEIEYAGGRKSEIAVGADFALGKPGRSGILLPDSVALNLKSRSGAPLGLELVFSKEFFHGTARAFLALTRSLQESAVEAGVRVAW